MQTAGDVIGQIVSLFGDEPRQVTDDTYLLPKINTAYQNAIQYLKGSCSPYIKKVVVIPGVPLGADPSNLTPYNTATGGNTAVYPLKHLVTPQYIDFKLPNTPANQFRPAKEYSILPDTVQQVTPQTYDIRVRGDFMPAPLTSEDSELEIYPNCAHALAYSTMALIGAERPNQAWVETYLPMSQSAWDEIASDLIRQQQRLPFRLGSPNRQGRQGWGWNLQGCLGYEWRSFQLFVKLV